jgi:predicted acetyltransferase
MTSFALRPATGKDLPAIAEAVGRSFGMHHSAADLADLERQLDLERFWLAVEPDDEVVGVTGSHDLRVTLPGGTTLPVAGVAWVGVAVTHRRRGVLRALFDRQHAEFVADGVALAALTASEASIYGRFGYGPTTVRRGVEITRRRAVLRPDLPDTGGVRQVGPDRMRELAPALYERWAAATPGAVRRDDVWWDQFLADREPHRGGATALFHLAHAGGFASYRWVHADRACRVVELVATTADAHRELWRALLAMDLTETVRFGSLPLDDPLPLLLTDPRQVRTTSLDDGMWVRVLDVAAALSARHYRVELDVVLDVADPYLDRGGRFRLRGGPDGATCETTSAAADAHLASTAIGPLLLGGQRALVLGRAGAVTADPAVLDRLDLAFGTDRLPVHGTEF